MASLGYLWKNRKKFRIGSSLFVRAWAKRLFSLKELIDRNKSRRSLGKKGADIHETAEIGDVKAEGSKKNLSVGAYSFIGKVELALHEKIVIGERVCINDGVVILTASHDVSDPEWKHVKAPVVIEDYAWICTNAILLPGVHIGRGAIVGAGAVVSKNVGAGQIVGGNPANLISTKRVEDLQYNPCEFLAANRAWLVG